MAFPDFFDCYPHSVEIGTERAEAVISGFRVEGQYPDCFMERSVALLEEQDGAQVISRIDTEDEAFTQCVPKTKNRLFSGAIL